MSSKSRPALRRLNGMQLFSNSSLNWCLIAVVATLFTSCTKKPEVVTQTKVDPLSYINSVPELTPGVSEAEFIEPEATGKFTLMPASETNVDFAAMVPPNHPMSRLYHSAFVSGGVAIGDLDGDGKADIFCASGPDESRFYRQTGNFQFEDYTEKSGMAGNKDSWTVGVSLVDIDNDMDLDIYLCNYNTPNQLWLNNGKGEFIEVAKLFGVDIVDASVMAYFGDFDNDGFLDMYLLTNRLYYEKGLFTEFDIVTVDNGFEIEERLKPYFKLKDTNGQLSLEYVGREDFLFRNLGGKAFQDVTARAGIKGEGHGLSMLWWDYDKDGDLDAYVCNDFNDPDCLYENDGKGNFTDVIANVFDHTSWFSMGSDIGDINNDQLADLVTVDMAGSSHYMSKIMMGDMSEQQEFLDTSEPRQLMRNFLHVNAGPMDFSSQRNIRFLESAQMSGVANTDWSWAPRFADFDSDGLCDLYVTNGFIRNYNDPDVFGRQESLMNRTYWQIFRDEKPMKMTNMAFRNTGKAKFENASENWGLDHLGMSLASATGDLDNDGDLDLVVINLDEPISIYRNDVANSNRVTVELVGQKSNRAGIGAEINVETDAGTQTRYMITQRGFLSCQQPIAHFGLGSEQKINKMTITWPSGNVQELSDVPINQKLTIVEPDKVTIPTRTPAVPPMFTEVSRENPVLHKELNFDDFATQPLLPNKLSQLGPGVAVTDLNGDGIDEFILASAKGQETQMVNYVDGALHAKKLWDDKDNEVLAPLFIDIDGDGDKDIYLVSGGVESGGKDELLEDRILINDGKNNFSVSETVSLADTRFSGSTVSAADYDRDGDLDLFVGGRVNPHEYPTAPRSVLLRNTTESADQPQFENAMDSDGKALTDLGMVTSSLWTDYDNDGWIDLFVTTEWGPVHVFRNQDGQLVDVTEDAGLAKFSGWWNGISGRDFDNDGDIDYVVTNFGLNTKYKPTPKTPSRIYYGAFGDSDEKRIIEAKVYGDTVLPVRGKSCSQNAMPFIREEFETYHDFAVSELVEIYPKESLENAQLFEVNELRSMLLINDGEGEFFAQPLPSIVQISPAFGVVTSDIDGDGNTDIYIVQNFYTPQRETGRMAGGLSVLLLGNGDGTFRPITTRESGLGVTGDAKGLSIADINNDQKPDFVISVNDSPTRIFENLSKNSFLCVELSGSEKNPSAIGATVTVEYSNGSSQSAEVAAGGSYLSQSTNKLFFGNKDAISKIHVKWPNGGKESFDVDKEAAVQKISQGE